MHCKAVRKSLVAIILNMLSTMFYSKTIKIQALAFIVVIDGVSPSPKRGGAEPARPPLNLPLGLATRLTCLTCPTRRPLALSTSTVGRGVYDCTMSRQSWTWWLYGFGSFGSSLKIVQFLWIWSGPVHWSKIQKLQLKVYRRLQLTG